MPGPPCPPENLLRPDARILAAVRLLETAAQRIALVVDAERRLLGTVTDGDVRRGLLRGIGLEAPLEAVMNPDPASGRAGQARDALLSSMRQRGILFLPILDAAGRVVGLESAQRLERLPPERDNLVVVMAGGRGRRLDPLTRSCPKPMLSVGGKPILERILEGFAANGFRRFRIAVNHLGDSIERHFGDGGRFGVEIDYLREEAPLGTAGALGLLRERPSSPLFLVNGDVLTRVNFDSMLSFHREQRAELTLGVSELDLEVPYGVVSLEGYRVERVVEKPVHRFLISAGVSVLDAGVLDRLRPGRPLDLPDLANELAAQERLVSVFPIHEFWVDVGRHADLERAETEFARRP